MTTIICWLNSLGWLAALCGPEDFASTIILTEASTWP